MRTLIVIVICVCLARTCSAQTDEALIKYKPTKIKLYESGINQTLKGKGIVRLTFDNPSNLNITASEFVYIIVFDSLTNETFFEYKIDQLKDESIEQTRFFIKSLDSIFNKMEFEIVNENYTSFIPRADFPFVFEVYPARQIKE